MARYKSEYWSKWAALLFRFGKKMGKIFWNRTAHCGMNRRLTNSLEYDYKEIE